LNLGVGERSVAEVAAQKPRCVKVNPAAENLRQLFLHREEVEAWSVTGLELNDHIHVTVRPKIVAKYRAEEREPANVMPPTKVANPLRRYFDSRAPHLIIPRIPLMAAPAPLSE
jgi:hypothetical protein